MIRRTLVLFTLLVAGSVYASPKSGHVSKKRITAAEQKRRQACDQELIECLDLAKSMESDGRAEQEDHCYSQHDQCVRRSPSPAQQ